MTDSARPDPLAAGDALAKWADTLDYFGQCGYCRDGRHKPDCPVFAYLEARVGMVALPLEVVLTLTNNVRGLAFAEDELRDVMSNTNWNCLQAAATAVSEAIGLPNPERGCSLVDARAALESAGG